MEIEPKFTNPTRRCKVASTLACVKLLILETLSCFIFILSCFTLLVNVRLQQVVDFGNAILFDIYF